MSKNNEITNNLYKYSYKTNNQKFNVINQKTKNIIWSFFILIAFAILVFLIMCISDIGYDPVMQIINQKIIFVIFISSFCLGISSFIVQMISKNKLADTSVLGIGSVNLLILVILVSSLNLANIKAIDSFNKSLPFIFVLFSMLASITIFFLSRKDKFKIDKKFILAGILFNFVFSAFASSISSVLTSTKQQIINSFSNGGVNQPNDDSYILFGMIVLFICIIWMLAIIRKFNIVTTNTLIATQLGINIKSIYLQAMIISGILTGVAFLMVGNVVFLGLLAGNIAYSIFKMNQKYTMINSGFFAFLILGFTFFINRNILTNTNLNTSYLIPIVACPYFLYLIIKK